ncbi:helix-turn-helix domain-containing protein [Streptomyces sp. H27-G5]|uniref:helix-turn-helix domain-containing protein n=1 Tax=Streptomyces sp. H27-G5 TaxID=2996698 RepID=UPI002270ED74|nr:helix-turn-helix domain-containing protein [Streptomyces sp. H27-G5]MCY0917502.1 helix-turn-helix domain-containing protein [Streptomyces sp. H27-G5]
MTQDVETASATGETDLPSPKERRRLRETAELTHEDLASALGVTTNTARSWENGRTGPRGRKREAYAKLLAHLAAEQGATADPPVEPSEQAEPTEQTEPAAPAAATAEHPTAEAATTIATATSGGAAPGAPPEADPGSDAEADTEAGATPASGAARRMAGAVRAFAAGGQGRPANPSHRPKVAAKRAAKPPASLARHESKTPVKSGSGGAGRAEPPYAPASGGRNRPDAPAEDVATAPANQTADQTVDQAANQTADQAVAGAEVDGTTTGQATPDTTGTDRPEPETAEPDTAEAGKSEDDRAADERAEGDRAEEDRTGKDPADEAAPAPGAALTPAQAFDALYAYAAPALARQTYLLTGRRALSLEAVERAFQNAWERWPEVATDPDPVGWVRATAYEHALSPWQRLRRAHRNPDQAPAEPADRILMDAMLALPPTHRRTVLLYDGVGLDLPDTAAETEASTPTAGVRLLHAHADLADRIPELAAVPAERHSALLRERLGAVRPPVRLDPREASVVRVACERRARLWSRAAIGLTAVIAVATAYTLTTAPTRYEPPVSPGANVSGVPPHSGPQALTERSKELHDTLRFHPAARPDRLAPTVG